MKEAVLDEMRHHFRPEFLNRVDEIIVFRPLDETQLATIVGLLLTAVEARLTESGIGLELTDAARALIARQGYDPQYGARPLRRAIQRLIENPLAKRILAGEYAQGDIVRIDAVDNQIVFTRERDGHTSPLVEAAPGATSGIVH
jgi:ATP-dependent Clp protease ATP-binding subunit ClpA